MRTKPKLTRETLRLLNSPIYKAVKLVLFPIYTWSFALSASKEAKERVKVHPGVFVLVLDSPKEEFRTHAADTRVFKNIT